MPEQPWRFFAACKGEDPNIFLQPERGEKRRAKVEAAKLICANCLVRQECLDEYTSSPQKVKEPVVAGGLTKRERLSYVRYISKRRLQTQASG